MKTTSTINTPIQIKSLSHDGRGIAHLNGKTIFIAGALPNETVRFRYLKQHSKYAEAEVVEILEPAADRITPRCPHFGICNGCSSQHINAAAQLRYKQQTLLDQLQQFAQTQPQQILPPLTGPIWGYRRKARLSAKYVIKKNKLLLGFHEKNGRYIADIQRCEILDDRLGPHLEELRQLLEQLQSNQHIPQVEVAFGDNTGALIIRHLQPLSDSDLAQLQHFVATHQLQLYLQPGGADSVWRYWPKADATADRLSYTLPDQQLELLFHPSDFTQVNAAINRQLVTRAIALFELQPTDQVLDLFCGLGNFTLALAQACASVVGIEGDAAMVQRAQDNAQHNGINNVKFYAANLASSDPLASVKLLRFNKILLDPPRTGALEVIQHLSVYQAERIVYVSCNPATLARDTKALIEQDYTLYQAGVLDMFPHTQHVEAIAVFIKNQPNTNT